MEPYKYGTGDSVSITSLDNKLLCNNAICFFEPDAKNWRHQVINKWLENW